MKKILYGVAASLIFVACNINEDVTHKKIAPKDGGFHLDPITDCTLSAKFTADDFDWHTSSLTFTVFTQDIYDSVDICQMKTGDTLIYEGRPIIVASIVENNSTIYINGGMEEGGACLVPCGSRTLRTQTWDDHSSYTEQIELKLMLADDFTIIDCGENPSDSSDTIRINHQDYIHQLPDYRKDYFFQLNTKIRIENGKISEIQRRWIP